MSERDVRLSAVAAFTRAAASRALSPLRTSGQLDVAAQRQGFDNWRTQAVPAGNTSVMHLNMLKAKIHRATVTHAELHYEGSIAIDGLLLDASGIREYEQIHAWDINNGQRFVTYALRAEEGSGIISVNGSAARSVQKGDLIIIAAFAQLNEAELEKFQPTLVYVDAANRISHTNRSIPKQMAAA
jgi:aspartate 1-decarboxylase